MIIKSKDISADIKMCNWDERINTQTINVNTLSRVLEILASRTEL